ncbi:hypothetical protein NC653_000645 [Populus alba x Populus x berolinensis]|uniref:Uncharacterized protein n=1 Tax=Populus alba x Populus x berolinensis TaxID=444605 RepID=A0AAD6RJI7_9ROSI|nr:hypothetical protein NC653_000645 [Populus alba x Populus x berolinensis]
MVLKEVRGEGEDEEEGRKREVVRSMKSVVVVLSFVEEEAKRVVVVVVGFAFSWKMEVKWACVVRELAVSRFPREYRKSVLFGACGFDGPLVIRGNGSEIIDSFNGLLLGATELSMSQWIANRKQQWDLGAQSKWSIIAVSGAVDIH